ncbi:MAG: hypothetical protein AB8C84_09240 [Oligoflexales bacterium]
MVYKKLALLCAPVIYITLSCSSSESEPPVVPLDPLTASMSLPMDMQTPLPQLTSQWLYKSMTRKGLTSFGGNPSPEIQVECHLQDSDTPCYFSSQFNELQKFPESITEHLYNSMREMRADLGSHGIITASIQCSALEPHDPPYELEKVTCSVLKTRHPREHFLNSEVSVHLTDSLIGNHPYPDQGVLTGSLRCWWNELDRPRCLTRKAPSNKVSAIPHMLSNELGEELLFLEKRTYGMQNHVKDNDKQLVADLYCEIDNRPAKKNQPRKSLCRIQMTNFKG